MILKREKRNNNSNKSLKKVDFAIKQYSLFYMSLNKISNNETTKVYYDNLYSLFQYLTNKD